MNRPDADETINIQGLIVGTLALMTHWAETGCRQSVDRVVKNLRQLAIASGASPEFQTVASRMSERWTRLQRALDPRSSEDVPRSLH